MLPGNISLYRFVTVTKQYYFVHYFLRDKTILYITAAPKLVNSQDQYSSGVQAAVTEVNSAVEKTSTALVAIGNEKMLVPKKAPTMPKPQWHAPWKLYRVRTEQHVFYCVMLLVRSWHRQSHMMWVFFRVCSCRSLSFCH